MNTVTIALILFFVAAAMFIIWRDNRSRKANFLTKMKSMWGKIPQREYTYDDLERISQFFYKRKKEGFLIDDITWNDLDLDRMFALMNQCVSSVGEDCLYDLMRRPVFEEEELKERHRLMQFFTQNEEARSKIQQLLANIRKSGNSSIYEAVHATGEVSVSGKGFQIGSLLLLLLSIMVFMIRPDIGVYLFIGMCMINVISYLMKKQETEVYLASFRCAIQLLQAQKELEKLKIPQLEKYVQRGRLYKKALAGLQRGAFLVVDRNSAGGGLGGFVMDYVRMLTHIDLIKFYDMLSAIQENYEFIDGLIENFGYLDAMISLASFRASLPYYSLPEFEMGNDVAMQVKDLYHPLLSNPVANSMEARGGILVTGSNASGKSTFLKNIAVNAILAQTAYTCTANFYKAPYLKVMTSMALRDNLQGGESYYVVEIRSLKRILDESKQEGALLCIIDEVLRGTNTIERIGASSRILEKIQRPNVLTFAATHDIELSYILENFYENYHFEEEFKEKDIIFNYLLKKGRVTTRNAIRFLEIMDYDKDIVKDAQKAVSDFEGTGIWNKIEKTEE